MTREEFLEEVQDFDDLLCFCNDVGCYEVCEDVYTEEAMDSEIDDNLVDMARDNYWRDLLDVLNSYPDRGADYYINDNGEYREADEDDFDYYKREVLEYCDDNDLWDEEDDEDENVVEEDDHEFNPYDWDEDDEEEREFRPYVEDSDDDGDNIADDNQIAIEELFFASSDQLQQIQLKETERHVSENEEYQNLIQF